MKKWGDDPFTIRAKREDYGARSVYKLEEIQQRDRILDGARTVLDLGASPGSWSQYCLRTFPQLSIYALDLSPIDLSSERLTFVQADIECVDMAKLIGPHKTVDVVLSDMAPKTTGIRDIDVNRSLDLVMTALRIAGRYLRPGGNMVAKLFMGGALSDCEGEFKALFETVRLLRPEATRKRSMEIYIVGKKKLG